MWFHLLLVALLGAPQLPGSGARQDAPAGPESTGLGPTLDGLADMLVRGPEPSVEEPRWDSLESPRHAFMTFFEAMGHALEGKSLGLERALPTLGPEATEQQATLLKEILDRLGEPDPLDLPGPRGVREKDLRRYAFFPRASHAWVWDELDEPPVGRIVLARDDAGEWRFDAETVEGIGELWSSTAALPPRNEDTAAFSSWVGLFGPTLETTEPIEWILLFGAIALGVAVGLVVRKVTGRLRKWVESRGYEAWASSLNVGGPLALACAAAGLGFGLRAVHLSESLQTVVFGFVTFLFILSLGWGLLNLVDVLGAQLRHWTSSSSSTALDQMVVPLITKSVRIFLVTVVAVVLLERVLGIDVTGFLAGIGLIGLALSLAAKDSLQNLFGALTIYVEKPFRVGDVIRFKGSFGTVEEIGLRATTLRLLNGDIVYQPNMAFIAEKVENVSIRPHIRRELDLTLRYDTPVQKVEEAVSIVRGLLSEGPLAEAGRFDLEELPPRVMFNEFNDSSLNLRAYYWYQIEDVRDSGWFDYLEHCQDVNLAIMRDFDEAGIEFAYPTRTIFMEGGTGPSDEAVSDDAELRETIAAGKEPVDTGDSDADDGEG